MNVRDFNLKSFPGDFITWTIFRDKNLNFNYLSSQTFYFKSDKSILNL